MARSPKHVFQFQKQEKATGNYIWRIRWLSDDPRLIFGQQQTVSKQKAS